MFSIETAFFHHIRKKDLLFFYYSISWNNTTTKNNKKQQKPIKINDKFDNFIQLSYLKTSLAIISAVARLYPFFKYPCTIVPNIPLTISSSISQYACISPDRAISTYSIDLSSNNLCYFASDCSVVLRVASTSSHFIRSIFPSAYLTYF